MHKVKVVGGGLLMLGLSLLLFHTLPAAGAARLAKRLLAATWTRNTRGRTYIVTATVYAAVAGQTDSKPYVTADNSRIPRSYSSHTRWLALSRDLLQPWGGPFEFGDKVRVRGVSPQLDGVYTVHDTMNRRYRHRLDLLVHPREHVTLYQPGVKLQRISHSAPANPSPKASSKPLRQENRSHHFARRRKEQVTPKVLVGSAKKASALHKHRKPLPTARLADSTSPKALPSKRTHSRG